MKLLEAWKSSITRNKGSDLSPCGVVLNGLIYKPNRAALAMMGKNVIPLVWYGTSYSGDLIVLTEEEAKSDRFEPHVE